MGDIINLPNARKRKRAKLEDVLVEKLPDYEQHNSIGDIQFTCATCGHTSGFSFKFIIFKICEFYCSACGTGYKISNPLFAKNKKSKIQ